MIIFLEFKIQVLFETSSICFHYVCGSGILYFLTTSRSPIIVVKLNCVRCMIFYHQLFCYSFAMIYHSLYPPRQGHLRLRILCIISIAYYNSVKAKGHFVKGTHWLHNKEIIKYYRHRFFCYSCEMKICRSCHPLPQDQVRRPILIYSIMIA